MATNATGKDCAVFLAALLVLIPLVGGAQPEAAVATLITRAGSAAEEGERLEFLRELLAVEGLSDTFREQTKRLIDGIERWSNDRNLGYFGGEVRKTDDFDFGIPEDSPLY
ncbi:MAG TPA: hypothetical protein PKL84_17860, partial [Candidatus Hydrogenedentes bacterium]|nr:hypothetical protein [Candidatus Hydrogenedentota bacterium]